MDPYRSIDRNQATLHATIRTILNVQEHIPKRLQALGSLRPFFQTPENFLLLRKSFDKLLPTLEQLLTDRAQSIRQQTAAALGALGTSLRADDLRFQNWVFQSLQATSHKDQKVLYLSILKEFVEGSDKRSLEPNVSVILDQTLSYLDNVEDYELIFPNIQILAVIGSNYPQYFQPHFQDVVDILLGWKLDPNTPDNMAQLISETLLSFRPYWESNVAFSLDLLDKFVADMAGLAKSSETRSQQSQSIPRLLSFIECSTIVLQGISSLLSKHASTVVPRMLNCFKSLQTRFREKEAALWMPKANLALLWIAQSIGLDFSNYYLNALPFLTAQLSPIPASNVLCDLLQTHVKILKFQSFKTPLSSIKDLLDNIAMLRFHPSQNVFGAVLAVYKQLLNCGSTVLKEVIRLLLEECTQLRAQLSESPNASEITERGVRAKSEKKKLTQSDVIKLLSFNFFLFPQIPSKTEANDTILPSLLELYEAFHPFQNKAIEAHPKLQLAICNSFKELTARIELSKSIEHTAKNLKGSFIHCGLKTKSNVGIKLFTLDWISNLCAEPKEFNHLNIHHLVDALVHLGDDSEHEVRRYVGESLRKIIIVVLNQISNSVSNSGRLFGPNQISSIAQLALLRTGDSNEKVKQVFTELLAHLTPSVLLMRSGVTYHKFKSRLNQMDWQIGAFHAHHFQRAMSFMGQKQIETPGWLSDMFYSFITHPTTKAEWSKRFDELKKGEAVSESILWFWLCWETAKFCIITRLRTPFGNPSKTLETIEKIVSVSSILLSQLASNSSRIVWNISSGNLLLQFIDYLEKQIHLTKDLVIPTSIPLSQSQKNSALFFRANGKVCDDWFARIRQHLLNLGYLSNSNTHVIYYATQRLLDLKNAGKQGTIKDPRRFHFDLELTLVHLGSSLLKLREQDMIEGLILWTKTELQPALPSSVSVSFRWLQPLLLQCQGRYEKAAAEYRQILHSETWAAQAANSMEFIISQVTECYLNVGDWDCTESWISEMQQFRLKHTNIAKTPFSPKVDWNYVRALASFDKGDFASAQNFANQLPKINSMEDCDGIPFLKLQASEQLVLQSLLSSEDQERIRNLDLAKSLLQDTLCANIFNPPQNVHPYLIQLRIIHQVEGHDNLHLGSNLIWSKTSFNDLRDDVGSWFKLYRTVNFLNSRKGKAATEPEQNYNKFKHQLSKLARKLENFKLAQRLINSEISNLSAENAQFLYSQDKKKDAVVHLLQLLKTNPKLSQNPRDKAHLCLKLASWMHKERKTLKFEDLKGYLTLPSNFKEQTLEKLSGVYLEQATAADANLPKAWFQYADWAYRQGTKIVESLNSEDKLGNLNDSEKEQIIKILNDKQADLGNDFHEVTAKLFASFGGFSIEGLPFDVTHHQSQREIASSVLKSILGIYTWFSKPLLEDLIAVWLAVRRRILSYFDLAISCYFKYLNLYLSHSSQKISKSGEAQERISIVATLRLFRLLFKYGSDLEDTFQAGFKTTPSSPWKDIIPQLFARLGGGGGPYAQNQAVDLILQIGKEFPHLVIYATLVACSNMSNVNSQQKQIQQIRQSLLDENSQLVTEVELLINEFTRLTTLWEEQWMATLQRVQVEIPAKMRNYKNEALRIIEHSNASKSEKKQMLIEKYSTIMKPLIHTLDQLLKSTSRTPETGHEKWFVATYGDALKKAFNTFKNFPLPDTPLDEDSNPEMAWKPMKDLANEFNRFLKPTSLKLANISPQLIKTKFSMIPMPGLQAGDMAELVTIESFDNSVSILPTKTRPKKLTIVGSNGLKYGYLIKGSEDLHLDERIMQLLTVVNQLLSNDKQSSLRGLRARKYAVIPLSQTSGLIQWVDNSVPLFSLYKHWQRMEKEHAILLKQSGAKDAALANLTKDIMRPSDMFYAKIIPALKEKGITNILSRKDWPIDVLRKVFMELQNETPRDLISKEFWSKSATSSEWWAKSQKFKGSVAVMSIIGYLIGLGDRHLDNILLDSNSAEIIHIDYNVCFEKGLNLKVPEKVPFRLSQNIQTALGLTGIHGPFTIACNHVLSLLRKNKEILLTLLEAFIYDPLVDWAADKEEDHTQKLTELNITLTLFSSRIEEMKVPLKESKSQFLAKVSNLATVLKVFHTALKQRNELISNVEESQTQRQSLENALTSSQAEEVQIRLRLETSSSQHSSLLREKDARESQISRLIEKSLQIQTNYNNIIHVTKGPFLASIQNSLPEKPKQFGEILVQASGLVSVGESFWKDASNAETMLLSLLNRAHHSLIQAAQDLQAYRAIILQMPSNYSQKNKHFEYSQVFQTLLSDSSTLTSCREIVSQPAYLQLSLSEYTQMKQSLLAEKDEIFDEIKELNQRNQLADEFASYEKELQASFRKVSEEFPPNQLLHSAVPFLLQQTLEEFPELTNGFANESLEEDFEEVADRVGKILELVQASSPETLETNGYDLQTAIEAFPKLEDFQRRFQTVVLPNILKALQAGDISVVQTIKEFNQFMTKFDVLESLSWEETEDRKSRLAMEVNSSEKFFNQLKKTWEERETKQSGAQGSPEDWSYLDLSFRELSRNKSGGKQLLQSFDEFLCSLQQFSFQNSKIDDGVEKEVFFRKKLEVLDSIFGCLCTGLFGKQQQELTDDKNSVAPLIPVDPAQLAEICRSASRILQLFTRCYFASVFGPVFHDKIKRFLSFLSQTASSTELSEGQIELLKSLLNSHINLKTAQKEQRDFNRTLLQLQNELENKEAEIQRFYWLYGYESSSNQITDNSGPIEAKEPPNTPLRNKIMESLFYHFTELSDLYNELLNGQKRYTEFETMILESLHPSAKKKALVDATKSRWEYFVFLKDKVNSLAKLLEGLLDFESSRFWSPQTEALQQNYKNVLDPFEKILSLFLSNMEEAKQLERRLTELQAERKLLLVNRNQTLTKLAEWSKQAEVVENTFKEAEKSWVNHRDETQKDLDVYNSLIDEIKPLVPNIISLTEEIETAFPIHRMSKHLQRIQQKFANDYQKILELAMINQVQDLEHISATVQAFLITGENQYLQLLNLAREAGLFVKAQGEETKQRDTTNQEAIPSENIEERNAKSRTESSVSNSVDPATLPDASNPDTSEPPVTQENDSGSFKSSQDESQEDNNFDGQTNASAADVERNIAEAKEKELSAELANEIEAEDLSQDLSETEPASAKQSSSEEGVPKLPVAKAMAPTRNQHAINVLKRVRAKLEGKDGNFSSKLSVADQVNWVIQEAINVDNLCLLYEGWTSWV